MRGDEIVMTPLEAVLLMAGLGVTIIWALCETSRRACLRGSLQRYAFATIERACRWPSGAYWLYSIYIEAHVFRDWGMVLTSCIGAAVWLVLYWDKRKNGNDDDFWSQSKKKILGMVRSLRTRISPSPMPVPSAA